jgi:SAM-dependent methyltransferase
VAAMAEGFATCALCVKGYLRPQRRFATDPYTAESIFLCACSGCAALSLSPQPSPQYIADQYAGYFQRRSPDTRIKVPAFLWMLRRLGISLSGKRVLDAGAGEGNLVRAINLAAPTARVTAVEPLWKPELADDLEVEVIAEPFERFIAHYAGARFDVVFLLDFIEHLQAPRNAIVELAARLLKPGGQLVVTTPNSDAASRRLFGRMWPQYKVEHLFYYSRASLRAIGDAAGLTTVSLRTHQKRLPIEYLLNVGGSFGPPLLQRGVRWLNKLVPRPVQRLSITARYGEWLWVASKVPVSETGL